MKLAHSGGKKITMRKFAEVLSLLALTVLAWTTCHALAGPQPLPDHIPTHFDFAGQPNGWGSWHSLLFLPSVALALYILLAVVSRFPSMFNYPVRVTPENRSRLEDLALGMLTWMKAEVLCLFAWIQWAILASARSGRGELPFVLLPVALVVTAGTTGWYIAAMRRTGRR